MRQMTPIRSTSFRFSALALVAATSLLGAACSAKEPGTDGHASGKATVVRVSERDFHISVRPARVPAGLVRLVVHNKGPVNHELIVVRGPNPRLALRTDGLTVDEEALDRATLGAVEPAEPHATNELRLRLTRGRYELLCNMAGHYIGGMRTELVVR
jgi:uncharacterized cupredoxin-like copper-binding protein